MFECTYIFLIHTGWASHTMGSPYMAPTADSSRSAYILVKMTGRNLDGDVQYDGVGERV